MNVLEMQKIAADLQFIADELWGQGGRIGEARKLEAIAAILAAAPAAVVQAEPSEDAKDALRDLMHIGAYLKSAGAAETIMNRLASVSEFIARGAK